MTLRLGLIWPIDIDGHREEIYTITVASSSKLMEDEWLSNIKIIEKIQRIPFTDNLVAAI
jgi:hypothetical protein